MPHENISDMVNMDNNTTDKTTVSYTKLRHYLDVRSVVEPHTTSIQVPTTETVEIEGNRIIDVQILSSIFGMLSCPDCQQQSIEMDETKKQGAAHEIKLSCQCGWEHKFWTSKKAKTRGFDINKRLVYAFRSCGQGINGMKRIFSLINMPTPMTRTNYDKTSANVKKSGKEYC